MVLKGVGEAAELAMSTAVSVEAMHRQAKIVADLASNCSAKEQQEMSSSGSESDEDDEEDEELKAAKKAAKEAEAKRREEENERARREQEEQGDPEANLGPGAKLRLANVRMLRKLSAEVREGQEKLRQLVSAAPQLMPAVLAGRGPSPVKATAARHQLIPATKLRARRIKARSELLVMSR